MNERILTDDEIKALEHAWATAPNIDRAAKQLGISRPTARAWARKLGFERPSNNFWTPERVELLISLVNQGYSGGVIAARLGVTRNSVIGKVCRLGMQLGNSRNSMRQSTANRLRKPRQIPVNTGRNHKIFNKPVLEKAPIPPPNVEDIPRIQFSELEPHHCRFPVGDIRIPETFGFCGLERMPGSSYCCGHHARTHVSVPVKRQDTAPARETSGVMA